MIIFNYLKFNNILSYRGEDLFCYNFKNGITQLSGKVGFGKSTIIEAFHFNIKGKAYRDIKLEKLVNDTIEKDLYTELEFTKNEDVYKVIRTYKSNPDRFQIFKNNELLPIPVSKSNYQEILYDILEINDEYLDLVLIKSKVKPLSFLSMKKADRILFIEQMFNISKISKISELLDIDIKDLKSLLVNNGNKLNDLLQFKNKLQNKIDQIRKLNKENDLKLIEQKKLSIINITPELSKYEKALVMVNNIKSVNDSLYSKMNIKNSEINNIKKQIDNLKIKNKVEEERLLFFKTNCPECDKPKKIQNKINIDNDNKQLQINELKEEYEELQTEYNNLKIQYEKNLPNIAKYNTIVNNIRNLKNDLKCLENDINELSNKVYDNIEDSDLTQIENDIKTIENNNDVDTNDKNKLETLKKLLTPLKYYIMKQRLLFLNIKINEYANKFNLPFVVLFDEKFEPKIYIQSNKTKTKDYYGLSEGQKSKIDLSIIFALIDLSLDLSKQQYNVLFLDEIFDSLDGETVDIIMQILKDKSENMEIIFISHANNFDVNKIDRRFLISNEFGYSNFIEDLS